MNLNRHSDNRDLPKTDAVFLIAMIIGLMTLPFCYVGYLRNDIMYYISTIICSLCALMFIGRSVTLLINCKTIVIPNLASIWLSIFFIPYITAILGLLVMMNGDEPVFYPYMDSGDLFLYALGEFVILAICNIRNRKRNN
ncbi:MAG: hypothetical protein K2H47_13010 [Muribaculaceae bacterium]|nr:hypothetical protein [Muribaculaceae bacterium]